MMFGKESGQKDKVLETQVPLIQVVTNYCFTKEMEKATKHMHKKLCWFVLTVSCSCLQAQANGGCSTFIVQCITTAPKKNIFKISGTIIKYQVH